MQYSLRRFIDFMTREPDSTLYAEIMTHAQSTIKEWTVHELKSTDNDFEFNLLVTLGTISLTKNNITTWNKLARIVSTTNESSAITRLNEQAAKLLVCYTSSFVRYWKIRFVESFCSDKDDDFKTQVRTLLDKSPVILLVPFVQNALDDVSSSK